MKPFVFAAAASLALVCGAAEPKAPWMTPEVNSINRLPARAIAVPCESKKLALSIAKGEKPRTESKWIESLDGTWNFKWRKNILEKNWEKTGTIAVPGCWQLQGDYDPPLYTNIAFPIPDNGTGNPMLDPPKEFTSCKYRNPVGLYSRTFTLPADWKDRRTVIHFDGVSSAMYVRLNGKEVGYSEDSRLPAEFDLTQYLKSGENTLEVEVIKHCDGTFLEDQDFWRLSGIFRSVWLVSEHKNAAKDLIVDATLSDDYKSGKLVVRDENGKSLLEKTYANPKLWSCETPNMYYATVEMQGDYRTVAFGFRRVEIKKSVLYINGKRALFKGVNRHEMQPEGGYTVTLEGMKRDIEIFHQLNINAVRTCHYPNDPRWYELCDREGIYVVCEANIESHGAGYGDKSYAHKAPYLQTHVERNVNMVKTFRNHPSVVIWSMGNEAGDGKNFTAAYKAIRELDPSRPIHYERALNGDNTDIMAQMYTRPWDVEKYVKNNPKKPFILCEYSHAMGNSNGDIHDYWKLVRTYPSAQGGFIWDFVDQAIWKTDNRGKYLSFGGDYADSPNDDNFCCNGIVDALRNVHPGAYEVKHAYQPVHVRAFNFENGEAEIYNEFRFIGLKGGKARWVAAKDGVKIASGKFKIDDLDADSAKKISIGEKAAGADAVTFRFMKKGREIAHDQFVRPFVAKAVQTVKGEKVEGLFKLNFWRAPNDNDRGWGMEKVCKEWKQATLEQKMPKDCSSELVATKVGEGKYHVCLKVKIAGNLSPVPRIGLTFTLPKDFTGVKWYGEGPWENYSDRAVASMLGIYSAKVGLVSGIAGSNGTIEYPESRLNPDNYSEPGEQGYRTGCRWMELSNGKKTVKVTALETPFGFNVWPYSQKALEAAHHQWDLKAEDNVTVNIDARQMGIGGDDSWGARAHDDDMIGKGEYRLSFMIEGL